MVRLASWPSDKAFVSGARDLKFKSPVKLDTLLPTARHRCDISSNGAVLLGRNDTEIGPVNSFHTSA